MAAHRCSICNSVSDPELAILPTEYKRQSFHPIEGEADTLCSECFGEIYDVSLEWGMEDSLEEEESADQEI